MNPAILHVDDILHWGEYLYGAENLEFYFAGRRKSYEPPESIPRGNLLHARTSLSYIPREALESAGVVYDPAAPYMPSNAIGSAWAQREGPDLVTAITTKIGGYRGSITELKSGQEEEFKYYYFHAQDWSQGRFGKALAKEIYSFAGHGGWADAEPRPLMFLDKTRAVMCRLLPATRSQVYIHWLRLGIGPGINAFRAPQSLTQIHTSAVVDVAKTTLLKWQQGGKIRTADLIALQLLVMSDPDSPEIVIEDEELNTRRVELWFQNLNQRGHLGFMVENKIETHLETNLWHQKISQL